MKLMIVLALFLSPVFSFAADDCESVAINYFENSRLVQLRVDKITEFAREGLGGLIGEPKALLYDSSINHMGDQYKTYLVIQSVDEGNAILEQMSPVIMKISVEKLSGGICEISGEAGLVGFVDLDVEDAL